MQGKEETEQKKPLTLSRPGRLELKKTVETGQVRQSFPHGRSKTVQVEIKRKRTFAPTTGGAMKEVVASQDSVAAEAEKDAVASLKSLTDVERAARVRALRGAMKEEEAREFAEAEEARRQAEHEARRKLEEAEAQRRAEEEEARRRVEEEARRRSEEEARRATAERVAKPVSPTKAEAPARVGEEEEARGRRPGKGEPRRAPPARRGEPRRRAGKLTIAQALDEDRGERTRSLAALKRAREREKQRAKQTLAEQPTKVVREVVVPEAITVQDLANRMAERGADVIKALMKMGVMATITQSIDADTAELVATEFGHKVKRVSESDVELGLRGEPDRTENLQPRAPVVVVMGHVDHGKTSLLDALRETDVVNREAGGITQHIGAYQVTLPSGQKITFIDTPGHAAFTEMRARGADVTDIVVLVVAADDGVMDQTVEAIHHAKAAGVPIIVAINKCDRPDADPEKVRQQLLGHEVQVEQFGGDVLAIEVSATEKTNLDKLEEAMLLQAELMELKANPNRSAEGAVIEAKMEQGRGSMATVLVQGGTLRVGDTFIAGSEWGRVRALIDDRGQAVDSAGPSVPVEVLGLNGTPQAGDDFVVVDNEARAREVSDFRRRRYREARAAAGGRGTLEQMFSSIAAGDTRELPLVIKADVQGSVEAIAQSVEKLSTDEVSVSVLHAGVGAINESDITLANASQALVIGFNVRAIPQAREMAKRADIDIRYYSVIYNVIDDVKALLGGLLPPQVRENMLGNAEVRQLFNISKVGKVAGCYVNEGSVRRGTRVRLLRDNVVVHEGNLKTLKRFKEDVRDVKEGYECGMAFENYNDIQVGDVIECFEMEEVARTL
ncbi:MAG: translation initiation factor IF-2 [Kiloniellales bacterium]